MRSYCYQDERRRSGILPVLQYRLPGLLGMFCAIALPLNGQSSAQDALETRVEKLTEAMARTQAELDESQKQLEELRTQVASLRQQIAAKSAEAAPSSDASQLAKAVDELRERQAVEESQIATHDQSKVESESKYPVKLTGLILMNGFVNTRQFDLPATPAVAVDGPGSTGASMRQTVLGLDARGHIFLERAATRISTWTSTAVHNRLARRELMREVFCACVQLMGRSTGDTPKHSSLTITR